MPGASKKKLASPKTTQRKSNKNTKCPLENTSAKKETPMTPYDYAKLKKKRYGKR